MIPFNKPAVVGNEFNYMQDALQRGKLSGNGYYNALCKKFFFEKYNFEKILLTNSCTDALEMAAILCNVREGDEVIIPSFTFPSCANAFLLRGAKIVFADSDLDSPNISISSIEKNITANTKAILVVHYAGIGCNMDAIVSIAKKNNLLLIEDCAHAIDAYYNTKPLGSFGDFATFSFHETKNIQCGEGGMLVVNNKAFSERADIIWEKGTNRVAFSEKLIEKYNWVDIGSSYLLSELQAAFLFGQLENLQKIQKKRKKICSYYFQKLSENAESNLISMTDLTLYNNGSIFYLLCRNSEERDALITYLSMKDIMAVFHYLPLHLSPFHLRNNIRVSLPNAENFSNTIIRLPLYYTLDEESIGIITTSIQTFYKN